MKAYFTALFKPIAFLLLMPTTLVVDFLLFPFDSSGFGLIRMLRNILLKR